MALLACEVCGASIQVSSRDAEVVCSECGSEYDVIVHASPLAYSVFLSVNPASGSAPLVVLVSGGVAVDGHPYVTTVYIYRNGVLIKTVRSDGLYGTFEVYDVLTEAGTYKYQAKAVGVESPVRTVTVTAPPAVKKATSLVLVGSPLLGIAPVTVTLWATLSDEAGGGVGGREASFYMNDEFQFSRITDERGRITTSVKITAEGTYKIVAEFAGDELYESSRSNVVTVNVTAPPPPPPPPPPPAYGVTVKDWVTKKPIEGAEVVVIDVGEAVTDVDGVADLTEVIPAPGTYEVGVRKTDYKSVKRTMEFPDVNVVELVPMWAIGLGVAAGAAVCTVVAVKAVKK